ncbi:hypothetical protein EYF80_059336 [Liparis tanakae]|uniref:Uncharacterized protein n=1 Tax=Liparis tanakae TaxID=230148 RepID=A0A4Z2EQC0_9TELE|nr:hypothetical protein EYF80_059336 [Liparis tanakae]
MRNKEGVSGAAWRKASQNATCRRFARLTQVDVEGAPLLGAGVEVAALHVEIARADRLGAKPVEQRHLGPRRNAHCGNTGNTRSGQHRPTASLRRHDGARRKQASDALKPSDTASTVVTVKRLEGRCAAESAPREELHDVETLQQKSSG